jgi:predicted N-acyltransferase
MKAVKLTDGTEIWITTGLEVTKRIPKVDRLKEFYKWKSEAKAEGIDVNEVTKKEWEEAHPENQSYFDVYYACYQVATERHNKEPMSHDEFWNLMDKDFKNNLELVTTAINELNGDEVEPDVKN